MFRCVLFSWRDIFSHTVIKHSYANLINADASSMILDLQEQSQSKHAVNVPPSSDLVLLFRNGSKNLCSSQSFCCRYSFSMCLLKLIRDFTVIGTLPEFGGVLFFIYIFDQQAGYYRGPLLFQQRSGFCLKSLVFYLEARGTVNYPHVVQVTWLVASDCKQGYDLSFGHLLSFGFQTS